MESRDLIHGHPLSFIEDLKVDGEKEVVCGVCEEPPSGLGYKCSECNFLCHKSCFELPGEIQHPLHPNHILRIRGPHGSYYCDACNKNFRRCFFYLCEDDHCDFSLDTKCASRWRVNKDDCHQHAYVPIFREIQFTCDACGEEGKDVTCLYCTICQLLIHTKCTSFPRTIKIGAHYHPLTLTYSVQVMEHAANILCKLCYKEVNIKYATYYCQKCSYAAHLSCASKCEAKWGDMNANIESAPLGSIGHVTSLLKDINRAKNERGLPREIKHFSHDQHDLILNYEEVKDDKLCDGCMQLISPPFYGCAQCKLFLHNVCAKLPTNARYLSPQLFFTLFSQAPFSDAAFKCDLCKQYRHGFFYKFEEDLNREMIADIQCFAIQETIKHEAHQHPLFLAATSKQKCKFCEERGFFVCSPCDFALGFRCATLPLIANNKYDEHPLKLTYPAKDKFGEYYCLICEKERDPNVWFYYCAECNFPAHPQCALGKYPYIKFGKTYKDEHHQHPFTIVRKTEYSPPCDVCGDYFDEVGLECTQCKLTVHPRFGDLEKVCLEELADKYGGE